MCTLDGHTKQLEAKLQTTRSAVEDMPVACFDLRHTAGLRAWAATASAGLTEADVTRAGAQLLSRACMTAVHAAHAAGHTQAAVAAGAAAGSEIRVQQLLT